MEILKKGTAHLSEVWRCNCPLWENVESKKTEVLTPKEAEQLESWDCRKKCTNSDDSYYYVGKWNTNN